jgi:hypothetical protein
MPTVPRRRWFLLVPPLLVTLLPRDAHANAAGPMRVVGDAIALFIMAFGVGALARLALAAVGRLFSKTPADGEGKPSRRRSYWPEVVFALLVSVPFAVLMSHDMSATGFRTKAKVSEAKSNLGAIRSTQIAYFTERGVYVGNQPLTPISDRRHHPEKRVWDQNTRFSILGFFPEGNVYFSYALEGPDWPSADQGFTIRAEGDLDNDGKVSIWTLTTGSNEITHSGDNF